MDARKAAAAYPELEQRIRTVLVEHDPSGLFALGCPRDEHDGQIHAIVSRLQSATTEDDVATILTAVFDGWAEDNLDARASRDGAAAWARKAAPRVWEAWRAFTAAAKCRALERG